MVCRAKWMTSANGSWILCSWLHSANQGKASCSDVQLVLRQSHTLGNCVPKSDHSNSNGQTQVFHRVEEFRRSGEGEPIRSSYDLNLKTFGGLFQLSFSILLHKPAWGCNCLVNHQSLSNLAPGGLILPTLGESTDRIKPVTSSFCIREKRTCFRDDQGRVQKALDRYLIMLLIPPASLVWP